jgi:hypothetical protein
MYQRPCALGEFDESRVDPLTQGAQRQRMPWRTSTFLGFCCGGFCLKVEPQAELLVREFARLAAVREIDPPFLFLAGTVCLQTDEAQRVHQQSGSLAAFSRLGPQLTRGWMLFDASSAASPCTRRAASPSVLSLWTTFDRVGTEIASGAVLERIER